MTIIALQTAATGMSAQELLTDVIANNLSNINTTGFKRNNPVFQDLLYLNQKRVGTNPVGDVIIPTGLQIGLGVRASAVTRNTQQGSFNQTDNTFDLAINGNGYFVVVLPNGDTAYTRAGNFTLNSSGQITTNEGYLLQPEIQIPSNALATTIDETGVVSSNIPQTVKASVLGTIELATFINENGLLALGQNLFASTEASGDAIIGDPGVENRGVIYQKWLENSNVNPINEITSLITAQRGYEMGSKVIQAVDEMMRVINSLKS